MKIEINEIIPLSHSEERIVEFHSVMNILNILTGQLQILNIDLNEDDFLKSVIEDLFSFAEIIRGGKIKNITQENVEELQKKILNTINENFTRYSEKVGDERLEKLIDNFKSIFSIMNIRLKEILNRTVDWDVFEIEKLKAEYIKVFKAIEKNSGGKYKIKYNINEKDKSDYLVSLNISNVDSQSIEIPPVFTDVFRDLLANARKYTHPGGEIYGDMVSDGEKIRIIVRDNGIGIPDIEISKVVNFGCRGSNVLDKRTMGGGFGLSKAFLACRDYGGRMWIESELGKGTIVSMEIPGRKASGKENDSSPQHTQ
jgi:signal transduction histidine kinase